MKIKNIKSNPSFTSLGLDIKEMRNLKQVVALFGKNGSGKTRLLRQVQREVEPKINRLEKLKQEIDSISPSLHKEFRTEGRRKLLLTKENEKKEIAKEIEFETSGSVILLDWRSGKISSPSNMNDTDYETNTQFLIANPRFQDVKEQCAKFIKALCKSEIARGYHDSHQGKHYFVNQDQKISQNIKLLALLKTIIKELMGKELDYFADTHLTPFITLNKRQIEPDELSDGEKELLAFSTFLALQQQENILNETLTLNGSIIILDELELFLHPQAQIDLINGLRRLVGENGQIWIATHSLAILSVLDRDEIWLMENGKIISPSIETPNKVISSLVGEDNLDALENFISSQYEWAAIQFALECLFAPPVSPFREGDPQQSQVKDRLLTSDSPITILDFGAGDGRIAKEIIRSPELASQVYYQPLEVTKTKHSQLQELTDQLQSLSRQESDKSREVLDTHEKLKESKYLDRFDLVLLINVLHEVPLNKWKAILNSLLGSLKPDGKLIILEDQAIPRGEHAHEYGFLILDVQEFQLLFSLENPPKNHIHPNPKYAGRLTYAEIPKEGSCVTDSSILAALNRKRTNCRTEITSLRNEDNKTARDGRRHSFLTQLFANVSMGIEDMS